MSKRTHSLARECALLASILSYSSHRIFEWTSLFVWRMSSGFYQKRTTAQRLSVLARTPAGRINAQRLYPASHCSSTFSKPYSRQGEGSRRYYKCSSSATFSAKAVRPYSCAFCLGRCTTFSPHFLVISFCSVHDFLRVALNFGLGGTIAKDDPSLQSIL